MYNEYKVKVDGARDEGLIAQADADLPGRVRVRERVDGESASVTVTALDWLTKLRGELDGNDGESLLERLHADLSTGGE